MTAMASSARTMTGTATPMPIFAPVDMPPLSAASCVEVAAGVGAVCVAPVFAAPVAVFCDIKFMIFWSLSCHCTWITSAIYGSRSAARVYRCEGDAARYGIVASCGGKVYAFEYSREGTGTRVAVVSGEGVTTVPILAGDTKAREELDLLTLDSTWRHGRRSEIFCQHSSMHRGKSQECSSYCIYGQNPVGNSLPLSGSSHIARSFLHPRLLSESMTLAEYRWRSEATAFA